MKTAKQFLAALLAALLTFSLTACNKGGGEVDIPANQTASEDFQKNMHQSLVRNIAYACETDEGIYFQWEAYVYYLEKASKKVTVLCGKPDCVHWGDDCNARLQARGLWVYDGRLYYSNRNYVEENGAYVNRGNRIYSVKPDGTDRRVVQALDFVPGGNTETSRTDPILHRGVTYFTYSGVLYALPLGGNIEDAERIWGEESEDPGMFFNTTAPHYTLWADGDTIYFMVNVGQPAGTDKDTLYCFNAAAKEVEEIWKTPDADEVGQWETTGVSVSQWYVMGGYIYFYLSGNDFWRASLETGETEKLADTHEKTEYGNAVFSDDYLCLLNDTPRTAATVGYDDLTGYTGGDTLYIYGLDGGFVKELSLKSLYEEYENLNHIQLAFCSGDDVYFLANATAYGQSGNAENGWTGGGQAVRNEILCCVNIKTEEITQIYNWVL